MRDHPTPRACIFLDRDGTINVEKNYLYRAEEWEWIQGSKQAIAFFKRAGYAVVVVSNQSGIARGKYTTVDVEKLHRVINLELDDAKIDAFYYCPHHPEPKDGTSCQCRKPKPGMLLQAAQDLDLNLKRSWMIGDRLIDVNAGKAAHLRSILVKTGYGTRETSQIGKEQIVTDNLLSACSYILDFDKTSHADN